jgi:hypothetical protein
MSSEEPGPHDAESRHQMSDERQPPVTQRSSSTPTIPQAFVWGLLAAALGSLLAWLGKLLSENPQPPSVVDSLHGLSTPVEMNKYIDALLAAGQATLGHDEGLATRLGFIVVGACLLSLFGALLYVLQMRQNNRAALPSRRTFIVICGLAIVPIALACGLKLMKNRLFHAALVVQEFSNANTSPPVVSPGTRVCVDLPVSMQSFRGYNEVESFSLSSSVASLSNGGRIPIELGSPEMIGDNPDQKPGVTDIIPAMLNVGPRASVTVPSDPQLSGAIVDMSASGTLRIMLQNRVMSPRSFEASATFRVARDKEVQFKTQFDRVSGRLTSYVFMSLVVAALVTFGTLILIPKRHADQTTTVNHNQTSGP